MRAQQEMFEFRTRGGARKGAGRKRRALRPNVLHRTRPFLSARHPVHVTVRAEAGLPSLRARHAHRVVRGALLAASNRLGVRILHFSVQTNHLHLICEAEGEQALSRGMKGLGVRIARRLNRFLGRAGRVIADRYFARALRTPREVRHALQYVLLNARRHGIHHSDIDPCSSGVWFDGWDVPVAARPAWRISPLPGPRTWLLCVGWRRDGPIPRG